MTTQRCEACAGEGCDECGGTGAWHRRSPGIRPSPSPTTPETRCAHSWDVSDPSASVCIRCGTRLTYTPAAPPDSPPPAVTGEGMAADPDFTPDERDPWFVLDFCEGAIRDAITLEDGLDASAGRSVLNMITNARAARRASLPSERAPR